MKLTPKRWDEFQHYRDRSPAWIKLHRKLLDDFSYSRLPLASRALAPLLWLLASEYEGGCINASEEEIAFRLRISVADLMDGLKPLIHEGFFNASDMLAECYQQASPEREREIQDKIQTKTDIPSVATATRRDAGKIFDEKFWPSYPKRDGSNPRKPARVAFVTAVKNGHDPKAIVEGVSGYVASLTKSGQIGSKYVAQAVTWLRQARWEDYPKVVEANPDSPPKPPDPSLPSHEELKRRYEANHDNRRNQESGGGIRGKGAGLCEIPAPGGTPAVPLPDDQKQRQPGMAGMGTIFHRSPLLRALGDEGGQDGLDSGNDRPRTVAGMVR